MFLFAYEDARSVPKNAGRNGRYKTGVVAAARSLGGQSFAPPRTKLSRDPKVADDYLGAIDSSGY
jgi:hypothetical protein